MAIKTTLLVRNRPCAMARSHKFLFMSIHFGYRRLCRMLTRACSKASLAALTSFSGLSETPGSCRRCVLLLDFMNQYILKITASMGRAHPSGLALFQKRRHTLAPLAGRSDLGDQSGGFTDQFVVQGTVHDRFNQGLRLSQRHGTTGYQCLRDLRDGCVYRAVFAQLLDKPQAMGFLCADALCRKHVPFGRL